MIYVNIPDSEYKKSEKSKVVNGVQYYYARFNEVSADGVTHAVECEIDHEPKAADFTALKAAWMENSKRWKKEAARGYAREASVKGFIVNDAQVEWLDSETRCSVRQAVEDKAAAGRATTVIYLSDGAHEMTIAAARTMLQTLEVYASDCYEKTEHHIAAIDALTKVEDIEAYDYTTGYPEMPSFTL